MSTGHSRPSTILSASRPRPAHPAVRFLQGLSPRARALGAGALGLALAGWLAFSAVTAAHRPQDLYPVPLPAAQLLEISGELDSRGIPFEVSVGRDGVLVAPADRARALQLLSARGLPRGLEEPAAGGSLQMMTSDERRSAETKALEAELERSLRRLDGVADADVKVARATGGILLGSETPPVTATVQLTLEPGVELTRGQVSGAAQVVAFSVPGLAPERVRVVDQRMRVLNPSADEASGGVALAPEELQWRIEEVLASRLQAQLDRVLGTGRAVAAVHVDVDHSQVETERRIFGGPAHGGVVRTGGNRIEEGFTRPGDEKRTYRKVQEAAKYAVNEAVIRSVERLPRISRTTCSVALDNLAPDNVALVERLSRATLGLDASRGDAIEVVSLPFAPLATVQADAPAAPVPAIPVSLPVGGVLIGVLGAALLAALGALRLAPARSAQAPAEGRVGAFGPLDPGASRSGAPSRLGETCVQRPADLERLEPRRVAELLKSTWLEN